MSRDDTYNGWTNRETWLVNVWYNPESREDVEMAREHLEEQLEALGACCLADMIDLGAVDWDELLGHFDDDDDEDSGRYRYGYHDSRGTDDEEEDEE